VAAGLPKFIPDVLRESKTCKRCALEKPRDAFHRRGSKGGLTSFCKECEKLRTYAWRSKNPGGHSAVQKAYRKRHPERVKASLRKWLGKHPTYEIFRSRRRYANPEARKKLREAVLRWGRRNPEKVLAYGKEYSHRKRANGGRGMTANEILDVLSRPCHYCGKMATELDHVIPVSRGGRHEPENVVPACRSCNSSKGSKTVEEWKSRRAHGGVT